jgi:hypothetical protein
MRIRNIARRTPFLISPRNPFRNARWISNRKPVEVLDRVRVREILFRVDLPPAKDPARDLFQEEANREALPAVAAVSHPFWEA